MCCATFARGLSSGPSLQKAKWKMGRWYPEFFVSIFHVAQCVGFEEACSTNAIQLTPDFEMENISAKTWFGKKRSPN